MGAVRLPEGMPDKVIIQKATDGLMRGFFVPGSMLAITDQAKPDVDVVINLHQCVAGNSGFFKQLWMSAWDLIAQLSLNGVQHGLFYSTGKDGGQPKWEVELMGAMIQFPMALEKCGLSTDMQTMLTDAIQSLKDVNVKLKIPTGQHATPNTADIMAKAVKDWTNWDFEGFGYQM